MLAASLTPDLDPQSAAPRTILVVDDEVLVRLTIAEYLRECGFHVFEAADGEEAVAILQASDRKVDLVFSDVQMPRMDGFSLVRWIRDNQASVRVMLTSGNPAMFAAKATELCLDGPMEAKPYDHETLVRRIQAMLERAQEG
jgi:CheY-like chemotaxis protein